MIIMRLLAVSLRFCYVLCLGSKVGMWSVWGGYGGRSGGVGVGRVGEGVGRGGGGGGAGVGS